MCFQNEMTYIDVVSTRTQHTTRFLWAPVHLLVTTMRSSTLHRSSVSSNSTGYLWHLMVVLVMALSAMMATSAHAEVPSDVVQRVSADGALKWHYPSRFERAMPKLEEAGKQSVKRLQKQLGWKAHEQVNVWVLEDLDDYFEWKGVPSRAPEWAVGLSLTGKRTVLVLNNVGKDGKLVNTAQTFEHELAHVAIDMARGAYPVPRWFNEGFAQYHANEWTLENSELVARSAASGVLTPMSDLTRSFPSHHNSTNIAYAQSHHFVRTLVDRYGEEVFGKILEQVRAGETFSVAFSMATGDDFETQTKEWSINLGKNSSMLSVFADGTVLFFGASLLFILAWGVRRRRSRLKFEHLDDGLDEWTYDPERYPLPGTPKQGRPGRPTLMVPSTH